jgi:hypothetical protein
VVEEIIGRLPRATAQGFLRGRGRGRCPNPCRHRAAPHRGPRVPPHKDGYLQLELRRYIRRDGSTRERGPYWYFQYHEGGKRRKLYLGKTSDPQSTLAAKRSKPLGE